MTAAILAGCGQGQADHGEDPTEPIHQYRQAVVGGVPSGEENDAVVHLTARDPDAARVCTATVVAPRMIVTARHCVSPFVDGEFSCTLDGNLGQSSGNAGRVGLPYAPELLEVRVGFAPFDQEPDALGEHVYVVPTDTICRNDIALVRLDREIDIAPRALRLTTATLPREEIMAIGYGMKDVSESGRYERADVEINAVGPSTIYPEGRGTYPRTFSVGPAVCQGDSGGPALTDSGAVAGVFSLIIGNCLSQNVANIYTQLAPYRDFVEQSFADSNLDPVYETPPSTTSGGEPGSGGAAGENGQATASSSAGSTGTGGTGDMATGGTTASGGGAAETSGAGGTGGTDGIIAGRRKPKEGCSLHVWHEPRGHAPAGALLLTGLLACCRRHRAALATRRTQA